MDPVKPPFDLHSRLHLLRFLTEINPDDPTTTDEYWADLLKNSDLATMLDMLQATILAKYVPEADPDVSFSLTNFA